MVFLFFFSPLFFVRVMGTYIITGCWLFELTSKGNTMGWSCDSPRLSRELAKLVVPEPYTEYRLAIQTEVWKVNPVLQHAPRSMTWRILVCNFWFCSWRSCLLSVFCLFSFVWSSIFWVYFFAFLSSCFMEVFELGWCNQLWQFLKVFLAWGVAQAPGTKKFPGAMQSEKIWLGLWGLAIILCSWQFFFEMLCV